jgi:hypothetical protein
MKIFEVAQPRKRALKEAKARIDHPEDVMFDENGIEGAQRALAALMHAADTHHETTTIKWDGSPAVIFGWLDKTTFIVTDKAGIGAKKYDGRPASAEEVSAMIYNRRPDQAGRAEYAAHFGGLYDLLKRATPTKTAGKMFQGDMLWMKAQDLTINDDKVNFSPNKVEYHIDKNSEIGKKIVRSRAGIAIHGMYESADEAASASAEPTPTSPDAVGIKSVPGLVVFGPSTNLTHETVVKLPAADIKRVQALINSPAAAKIDDMLDPFTIGTLKISNLPDVFKSFINFKARSGAEITNGKAVANEFMAWLKGPSGLTPSKQANVEAHINQFKQAFQTAWDIVAGITVIKHKIKDQLDKAVGDDMSSVQTGAGHEGFVSATPHGKIKLVNRPVFMKDKDK